MLVQSCSSVPVQQIVQIGDGRRGELPGEPPQGAQQWHRDELGITYLFSLNRKRSDADVVVTPNSGRTVVWQGRVLTMHRFAVPAR
ncbi:MAG: hypothetical protein II458_03030 [Oscillospiraceae bacterium]|nr:hypothetical protein [Oscillospiraceae bacterium]